MLKQLVHGCTVTWATMAAAVLAGTPVAAQSIDALPAELKALYTDSIPVGPSAYDDFKMPAKPWKWCHSESYMGNPWRVSMTNELKRLVDGAIAKGDAVSFELSDSNGDVPQQIAQIRAFIDKGCSIITTIAGSSTGLNDVIEAAYKAGIPVVTTASAVTSPYALNIQHNHNVWGYDMAKGIGEQLGGKGNVLMVEGIPGSPIVEHENSGGYRGLAEYPGLNNLGKVSGNWTANVTKNVILQTLATNPAQIDAGFRLKDHATPRKVVLSAELAYLLLATTGVVLFSAFFAGQTDGFLQPAFIFAWLLSCVGLDGMARLAPGRGVRAQVTAGLALAILVVWQGALRLEARDLSHRRFEMRYFDALATQVPGHSGFVAEDFLVDRMVLYERFSGPTFDANDLVAQVEAVPERVRQFTERGYGLFAFAKAASNLRRDGFVFDDASPLDEVAVRVGLLAVDGDRVVARAQALDRPGADHPAQPVGEQLGRHEQAVPGAREHVEQRRILELADHDRPHRVGHEPRVELAPEPGARAGQQEARAVERAREPVPHLAGQPRGPEHADPALAEQTIARGRVVRRRVRDHQIERVARQVGEQPRRRVLAAHQRRARLHRRLEDAVGDVLGHRVADADGEPARRRPAVPAHRLGDARAEREDLVGEPRDRRAGLGEHELAAVSAQQRLAELRGELTDLGGHRGLRHPEPPGHPRHAAVARDQPEVTQVVVVHIHWFSL